MPVRQPSQTGAPKRTKKILHDEASVTIFASLPFCGKNEGSASLDQPQRSKAAWRAENVQTGFGAQLDGARFSRLFFASFSLRL